MTLNGLLRYLPLTRFVGIKIWLKTLRLHKYAGVFEKLSYQKMMELDDDKMTALGESRRERALYSCPLQIMLGATGVTAKGARTKMLKSISNLKERMSAVSEEINNYQEVMVTQLLLQALQADLP